MKYRIALVEDDESLGYILTEYLRINNFEITWIKKAGEVISVLESATFDLLILDITLPDSTGFEIAELVKVKYPTLPFIFLTARSMKIDVLKGFALGAVDYLKKPIDEEELLARIKALLKRVATSDRSNSQHKEVRIGTYTFNSEQQYLERNGQTIRLTGRESSLLLYLATNVNTLCSHADILNLIWGKNDYFNKKSLNVFVSHLRGYLADDPNIRIENIRNRGFILMVSDNKESS